MDKYIKMLLMQISKKYKATLTHIMTGKGEDGVSNIFKIRITKKGDNKPVFVKDVYGKREVVTELMKWQK